MALIYMTPPTRGAARAQAAAEAEAAIDTARRAILRVGAYAALEPLEAAAREIDHAAAAAAQQGEPHA
jgi:hypothetical protein